MPTFKEAASSWKARMAIFAMVAVVALVAVSLGVPEAGGCGGALPPASPRIAANSNVDSPTITVDPPEAAKSFRIPQSIAASETENGATRTGSVALASVNYQTGTLTTTGENWSALIPGLKAGDYLVPVSAASQAMTYADGGGGGSGGGYNPPAPYWPYNAWITATHTCNQNMQPNNGYVSWSAASGGVYGYDIYDNGTWVASTSSGVRTVWLQGINAGSGSDTFQVYAYDFNYNDYAGPATTTVWPNCNWQPLTNGLPELRSVPHQLTGAAFAAWFDADPSYSTRVMPYVAACALPKDAKIEFRGQAWSGELGLAPAWPQGRFDADAQERVTACLMAHVNPSGRHVDLSLRSSSLAAPASIESKYWAKEAAWWGNAFDGSPKKYFCTMSARADGRTWFAADRGRVCDASNGWCGMTDVGDCSHACTGLRDDGSWSSCSAGGVLNAHPITSFDRD